MEKRKEVKTCAVFGSTDGYIRIDEEDLNAGYINIYEIGSYGYPEDVLRFLSDLATAIKKEYCKE